MGDETKNNIDGAMLSQRIKSYVTRQTPL